MHKGKRLIPAAFLAGFFLISPALYGQNYRFGLGGSFFYQSEKIFREIYGTGWKFHLDIGRALGKNLELHLDASYFKKYGELTYTKERTRVLVSPLELSLRYVFLRKKINLYAGGGLSYIIFEEKNPIGRAKENKVGLNLRLGGFHRIKSSKKLLKNLFVDFFIHYQYGKMKPAGISFDAGGFDIGIILGREF